MDISKDLILLQKIITSAQEAIILIDHTGRITIWNEAAEAIFGYASSEAVGKNVHELLAPASYHDAAGAGFEIFRQTGSGPIVGTTRELTAKRKDGSEFPIELSVSAFDVGGSWHAAGVVRDISERKRFEQSLRDSEERFVSLVNSVDGIVWEADARTFGFTFVSNKAERLLGYAMAEWFQPGFWAGHIHPDDREQAVEFCKSSTAALESHQFEYRFLARDGRVVWLRDIVSVLHDNHRPLLLRGLMVDITAQKLAAENVAALLAEHRAIFDNAIAGIVYLKHRKIVNANRRFEEIFGYRPGEMSGQSTEILYPDHEAFVATGKEAYATVGEGKSFQTELLLKRRDGTLFWGHLSGRAISPQQPQEGSIWIYTDITERKQAEEALRGSEERFRSLVEQSLVGVYVIQDGRFQYVNPRLAEIFGYAPQEMIGLSNLDVTAPEDRDLVTENIRRRLRNGIPGIDYTFQGLRKDGTRIDVEVFGSRTEINGRPAIIGTLLEITQRKRAEEQLLLSSIVFSRNAEGIVITDASPSILKVNRAFTQITGYSEAEAVGANPRMLKSGRQGREYYAAMWDTLGRTGFWQGEIWNRRKNGEVYPEWLSITAVRNEKGNVTNYIGVFGDLSQRKHAESMIQQLVHYDALTGLPNRLLLQDRLTQALRETTRRGRLVGVLQMDLDRFKDINDSLGHHVGDLLIETVGERLNSCVRNGDTVARQGGDEFCIVLSDLAQPQDAAMVADKILSRLGEPIQIEGQDFVVTGSIGISIFPDDGGDTETLLKNADTAMYHAKAEGRNNHQFYAAPMNALVFERMTLEKHLRNALAGNEFVLHYQPQVDLDSGRVIGMETLIRWRHPELGMVSPAKFIPLAEDTGLIIPIGEWVLRTACAQTRAWHDTGFPQLQVSVNLSARQFKQQNLSQAVRKIIGETGLAPECLELELTESMLVQNPERAITTLQELKAMGVRFSVDDFGTGYSSLSYLKRFPLDKLKIDQSFVRDISTDPSDAAITRAVIALGRSLGLRVIAEGVETPEQLRFLVANGCHGMQGYYFSKPLPVEQFTALLAEGRSLELPDGPR